MFFVSHTSTYLLFLFSDNVLIGDSYNHRIRKISAPTSVISTIAGTGANSFSGDNGAATSASICNPVGVAVDVSGKQYSLLDYAVLIRSTDESLRICIGNVYIADQGNQRIRKVTASNGVISTIAGTGAAGYSGDNGQATSANIKNPHGVNLDSAGNLYFGDYNGFNIIRKITVSTGIITTVAGIGSTSGGYNSDGIQATAAMLNYPADVILDSFGNLYITDRFNYRVRKVDVSTGIITTVIGTGAASSAGDGSASTAAAINGPNYSRFDSAGNYYITECEGHRVRKVITVTTDIPTAAPSVQPTHFPSLSPHSISVISTVAGTGTASFSGDNGQATSADINYPHGIDIDSSGNVYFNDAGNNRLRKITAATGIITTFAGTGSASYSGDGGAASSASLYYPIGLCIDSSGISSPSFSSCCVLQLNGPFLRQCLHR